MLPSLANVAQPDPLVDSGTAYIGGTTVRDSIRLLATIIDGKVSTISIHGDEFNSAGCFFLTSDYVRVS